MKDPASHEYLPILNALAEADNRMYHSGFTMRDRVRFYTYILTVPLRTLRTNPTVWEKIRGSIEKEIFVSILGHWDIPLDTPMKDLPTAQEESSGD